MTNVNKLKGRMVEKQMTVKELAEGIGMDTTTFYRRLQRGGDDFTIKEASAISKALGLTLEDVDAIFFAEFVA